MSANDPQYPQGVVLEEASCPNGCYADDETVLVGQDRIHNIPGSFPVVRCRQCGLLRTSPRPTPETIGAYYPTDYAPHRPPGGRPVRKARKWRHRVKARIERALGRDTRRLPAMPPGHMLELGCASGTYLLEMREQGWSVEGIEYSDAAAQHARALGIHVQTGSVESAGPPLRQADVVTAWMVLEHLHDPVHALRKIRDWVKPTGLLVGVVPDTDAFDRKLFGKHWYALHLPAHLYHYNRASLAKVLDAGGWELVATHWQPNERNLLNTLAYWLDGQDRPRTKQWLQWLSESRRARKLRRWLGWGLGLTRQSGRMEFWARPKHAGQDRPA